MFLFEFYNITMPTIDLFSLIDDHNFAITIGNLIDGTTILAQNTAEMQEIDIIGDFNKSWNNFVESGQIWAMLIGVFLGYTFRSFLP